MKLRTCIILSLFLLNSAGVSAQTNIRVTDSTITTIGDDFYGIQYHKNTYNSSVALEKLAPLPLSMVRIWAYPSKFHPEPGEWNWSDLDAKIAEVLAAGYTPAVCIFQAENWYTGNPQDPWWNNESALKEWKEMIREFALRYADDINWLIFFDEINYLRPENDYFMSFDQASRLFVESATIVDSIAPAIQTGGPSGFNGWENGHWADYVLNLPDGKEALDFVSSNIFLSWDKDDSDAEIMDKTIWYEEAPLKINDMIAGRDDPLLMLDAYNASALWTIDGTSDGELWTDPRNVNTFGGVYQTAALLHSAKGGFDITLRWETIGGYGIFEWYPDFKERPPYYAWRLLTEVAGFTPGASLLYTTTTEEPLQELPHHSGMNTDGFTVQPFSVLKNDGSISVILINKYDQDQEVSVYTPENTNYLEHFRFDSVRHANSLDRISSEFISERSTTLTLPALSVTVLNYSAKSLSSEEIPQIPENFVIHEAYPNPFNPVTNIAITLLRPSDVNISVYAIDGKHLQTLTNEFMPAGKHSFPFSAPQLSSGLYIVRYHIGDYLHAQKVTLIK